MHNGQIPGYPRCGPVAIGLMLASSAISAGGAVMAGRQQQEAENYQAAVARSNAAAAGQSGVLAVSQSQLNAQQIGLQRTRNLGGQIAAASKSGLTVAGSVKDTLMDSALQQQRDINNTLYSGQIQARNFGIQASGFNAQATLDQSAGRNAMTGGILSGLGAAVGGAAGAAEFSGMQNFQMYPQMGDSSVARRDSGD